MRPNTDDIQMMVWDADPDEKQAVNVSYADVRIVSSYMSIDEEVATYCGNGSVYVAVCRLGTYDLSVGANDDLKISSQHLT